MNAQLRNQRGADAYNAVCQMERRRNSEPQRPVTEAGENFILALVAVAALFVLAMRIAGVIQ
jgi:hypothetical protein